MGDEREQIGRVLGLVREVLGEDALGAYLHGSTASGRLRPGSDIDVLAVSRRATTTPEKRTLIDRLLPISGQGDPSGRSRPLELTIVVQSEVRPWRYPPGMDFQYGDWMREAFGRGEVTPWSSPNPDLAVLITMALRADRPVFGPPAAEVLDAVPHGDVVRAIVDCVPGLLDDLDKDTANVLLTLARNWVTVATGEIISKDAAADWALARLPEERRAVLARARAVYLGDEPDRWDDMRGHVGPHAEYVVREVRRLAAGG